MDAARTDGAFALGAVGGIAAMMTGLAAFGKGTAQGISGDRALTLAEGHEWAAAEGLGERSPLSRQATREGAEVVANNAGRSFRRGGLGIAAAGVGILAGSLVGIVVSGK